MTSRYVIAALAACLGLQQAAIVSAQEAAPPAPRPTPAGEAPAEPPPPPPARETVCDDRIDNDGDGMVDCADADCFDAPNCQAGGSPEDTDAACSDWVDNDGDGFIDCEDDDCAIPQVSVCRGSADRPRTGRRGGAAGRRGGSPLGAEPPDFGHLDMFGDSDLPEDMPEGMSVEELVGRGEDAGGERNDYLCSDGIDNDGDGRIDCADFGCRFDPSVTVCHGTPGLRFSVVAGVAASYDLEAGSPGEAADVRFDRIQLRALGAIPYIQNSFFLVNARFERSPRLTFIHFQVPISGAGHYFAINSGQGGLSPGLIISAAKQPLLDPAFYMLRAFEQGAGAAAEVGGPITTDSRLRFRLFAAGGAGNFNGNVGGRFFRGGDENVSWTAGGQIHLNLVGYYDRLDTPFVYVPEPLAVAVLLGGKYDQRPRERYPALNGFAVARYGHFLLRAETYVKRELEFGAWQLAWNAQASILIIPRHLMFAADAGQFTAGEFARRPTFDSGFRQPLDEWQWRAALHWFWFRNIGILTARYSESHIDENPDRPEDRQLERELRLEAQYRF